MRPSDDVTRPGEHSPTTENMAALIFPTCAQTNGKRNVLDPRERIGSEKTGGKHLVAEVEESDREASENDGEVEP